MVLVRLVFMYCRHANEVCTPPPHYTPPLSSRTPLLLVASSCSCCDEPTQSSYLSESRVAAAAFASRGDGSGTTVWPRSVFGNSTTAGAGAGVGATTGSCGSVPANARHKNIWYRLVRRRSAFGNSTTAGTGVGADVGATTKSNASVPADAQHKKFRYRLVAKCRVLKGDGVKEASTARLFGSLRIVMYVAALCLWRCGCRCGACRDRRQPILNATAVLFC